MTVRRRDAIFVEDELHMNAKGYGIWREVLRPILLKAELPLDPLNAGPWGDA